MKVEANEHIANRNFGEFRLERKPMLAEIVDGNGVDCNRNTSLQDSKKRGEKNGEKWVLKGAYKSVVALWD